MRMHEYSITFAADVDLAATAIERQAADSTVRRNAILWRVRAIPEMRKACFRLAPVGALVDAWIFARQMNQFFRDGAGAGAFGAFQPEAVEISRRLVQQMREIGGSIAVSPEAAAEFEHKFIDPWLTEHPLRDITFVRESPMGRFADQSPTGGEMLESVGTMEELAISLSQQARIYLAELPRQVRGEVDLMRFDMLSPESVASMQGDLHVSATAADRIASTAEGISALVPNERRIVLDELSRQRNLVMDAVSVERERAVNAIIRAFAAERSELLRSVELQRLATLEWATAERREAIADVRRELAGSMEAVRGERAVVVDDLRHIVDSGLAARGHIPRRRSGARAARRSRLRPCLAAAIALTADTIARTTPRTSCHRAHNASPTGGPPEYRRCREDNPGSCRAWSLHCQRLIL